MGRSPLEVNKKSSSTATGSTGSGLVARLVWQLILIKLQADDTMGGDPALEKILKSLLRITTVFEQHGTGGLK